MSRKLLLGIIVVLVITNIASLLIWNNDNADVASDEEVDIDTEEAVASIGGEEINYQDWMGALRNTYGENQLKTMIDYVVVNQLADEKNIEVDDKVVDREVALLTSMQGLMTAEEFEAEEEAWREDIRYRYQLEKLLTEDTTIPAEEIQRYYDEYGNQYDFRPTMQLSHILVRDSETAEQVTEELEDGASFDLLAQEYSIDEETKDEGGYLGFINTNSQFFPNGYEEVAADIEEHSYSEPFRADRGIAVIYVHRKLPAIEFTYEEKKPYVESELALQELNQSLTATPLWEELDIDWIYAE